MTDYIGQQFGNYHLTRLLGQGSFADVYLGEHIFLKTMVAVKLLQVRLLGSNLEDFLNEARAISRLDHPHIISVLDFGLKDDSPYLVMTYAPNGNLRQRYPYGTILPLNQVITSVKQIADALQYAHTQRLIHRDLKPENMLLGQRNEILLSDFGIAAVMQSSRPHGVHEIVGTVAYMAPEQIEGRPGPASDQYSLGIVVYEWLCGRRPFEGSFAELCSQQMVRLPPPLRERVPSLPASVEVVVRTALAKDPSQRFSNVRAFATALEQAARDATPYATNPISSPAYLVNNSSIGQNWTSSEQHNAPPVQQEAPPPFIKVPDIQEPDDPAPLPRPKPLVSRRTLLFGIAGVAGVSLIGGSLVWWTHHPVSPHKVTPPTVKIGTLLYVYPDHFDHVESVAWSPDGKRVASASDDKTVHVWDATTGKHVIMYTNHTDIVYSVAWSPDGKRIVSGSNDQTAQVWDASNGNTLFTYKGHVGNNGGGVTAVAWSPNGKRIASGSFDNTVQIWDATNGNPLFTYTQHTNEVHAVAWASDSKRIGSGGTDSTVRVWDTNTGHTILTYKGHQGFRVQAVAWAPDGLSIASGGFDSTVQVWDAANGLPIFNHRGVQFVNTVAWSPDGARLAVGNGDPTVQEWDPVTKRLLYTHVGPPGYVLTTAWSPKGQLMASGGSNNTVQVWQAV